MAQALQPFSPPIGIFPQFCLPHPVTLKMQERGLTSGSWTGDDFSITDTAGREVCKCKGKVMSISGRKLFTDATGRELFALKQRHIALSKSFYGVDTKTNETLFDVKGHFSILGSKSTVHFVNRCAASSPGGEIVLEMKGDWIARKAQVSLNGRIVATIGRDLFTLGEMFRDKQTYFVQCAPGVDLVLMAAICVCLDERENDAKGGTVGAGSLFKLF